MEKVRIVPAILTDEPKALASMIRQSETFTDYVQIDIMDGKFVPSCSINWEHIASLRPKLQWEAHLMVLNPEEQLESYKKAGVALVYIHYEATSNPSAAIEKAKKLGLRVGLAINPETPVSAVLPLAASLDGVLFMTVHPGFYGAKFLPEVMDKVGELRTSYPHITIGIDGGAKENNILQIARYGVDFICVGSSIFLQPDPGASYRKLTAMVQGKA